MKHKNTNREYAFLMVEYEMPDLIKDLHNKIKKEELYYDEDNDDYGIEKESHITLVPCLDNNVDLEKVKKKLDDISSYDAFLVDISKFECKDYDVLKCSAKSKALYDTNQKITSDFETHSEYKDYSPHMTIAYFKHGMADKYVKKILPKLIQIKAKNFHFSYIDKNGNEKHVKFD